MGLSIFFMLYFKFWSDAELKLIDVKVPSNGLKINLSEWTKITFAAPEFVDNIPTYLISSGELRSSCIGILAIF